MTQDEAAEALEQLVRARGPDWVANRIARVRLAGWLEGSEDLPEWMVTVMQVLTSGQREKTGDVDCFEDADDHPPEVPEDVTETGLNAVPMPTVGRGELLWDAYRLGTRQFHETGLRDLEDMAWQAAGEQCGVDDLLRDYGWLPDIMPVSAWDLHANWESLIRKLADVVRCAMKGDE